MTLGSLQSAVEPNGTGQNLGPHCLFPRDAQTLSFRGLTPSVVELYCFYVGRRKQKAIFLKMKAKLLPERERKVLRMKPPGHGSSGLERRTKRTEVCRLVGGNLGVGRKGNKSDRKREIKISTEIEVGSPSRTSPSWEPPKCFEEQSNPF